jgi:hypothetical protein
MTHPGQQPHETEEEYLKREEAYLKEVEQRRASLRKIRAQVEKRFGPVSTEVSR